MVSEKRSPETPSSRKKRIAFSTRSSTSSSLVKIRDSARPSAARLPQRPPMYTLNPYVLSVTTSNGHLSTQRPQWLHASVSMASFPSRTAAA